jgi:hypothetical protein
MRVAAGLQGANMAKYNTRIELQDLGAANHRDIYAKLHVAMESAGFSRFIAGDNGIGYLLPHAEYNKISRQPCQQVCEQARGIANSIHTPNDVITWEYSRASWYLSPSK